MGTDGRQLLALSQAGPDTFSNASGLLQLMAWLHRLPQNSNAAPYLFHCKLRGCWGGGGGRMGGGEGRGDGAGS